MTKSYKVLLSEVLSKSIIPILKKEGFKKQGNNFRKETNEAIYVINVQSSQWNWATGGTFTINLGIYYSQIDKKFTYTRDPQKPTIYNCHICTRIGRVFSSLDTWWDVRSQADVESVAKELLCIWPCVPEFFEKYSTLIKTYNAASSNSRLVREFTSHLAPPVADELWAVIKKHVLAKK